MNCHETTKMTTPRARPPRPSQSWVSSGMCRPEPRPKFGSSSALNVIAMAAELSSSGMKYSTARNPR
jgi:hypothetical protein